MKTMILKKIAFTLAEVLIVLGILGIIAELTIPTLLSNFQKQSQVTALKKFYTSFNQALKLLSIEHGCIDDLACTGLIRDQMPSLLGDELTKHIKTSQNCKETTDQNCFSENINIGYAGSGTILSSRNTATDAYKFITIDGMSVYIYIDSTNCASNSSISGKGPMSKRCGFLYVDTNGLKKPNRIGRDIFTFFITSGKGAMLYPYGGNDGVDGNWRTDCLPNSSFQCTGRIIDEGWEMNY